MLWKINYSDIVFTNVVRSPLLLTYLFVSHYSTHIYTYAQKKTEHRFKITLGLIMIDFAYANNANILVKRKSL